MRLDQYLVEQGIFPSRSRAQAAIRAGLVRLSGALAAKPSVNVLKGAHIEVLGDAHPYVSRGGVKLAKALQIFNIEPGEKICLDLGASTGGFCDVLLRAGAAKIYAVDVGTGQLHADISADPRIINLERTHAKDLSRALILEPVELVSCDVSFISARKALAPALALTAQQADAIILVKPQFELGPQALGKGGIVAPECAPEAVDLLCVWFEEQAGWRVMGTTQSPVAGGDGNLEFLLHARRDG